MNKKMSYNIEVNHLLYETLVESHERYAKVIAMLVISVIINIAFVLEMII